MKYLYLFSFAFALLPGALGHMRCGTKDPPPKYIAQTQQDMETLTRRLSGNSPSCVGCITIQTYITVFQPDAATEVVNLTTLDKQMVALNIAYSSSPFVFSLAATPQYKVNNQYYLEVEEQMGVDVVGGLYRQGGGAQDLNIYVSNAATDFSFATFPRHIAEGDTVRPGDGVFLHPRQIVDYDPTQLGFVLPHEGKRDPSTMITVAVSHLLLNFSSLLFHSPPSWALVG